MTLVLRTDGGSGTSGQLFSLELLQVPAHRTVTPGVRRGGSVLPLTTDLQLRAAGRGRSSPSRGAPRPPPQHGFQHTRPSPAGVTDKTRDFVLRTGPGWCLATPDSGLEGSILRYPAVCPQGLRPRGRMLSFCAGPLWMPARSSTGVRGPGHRTDRRPLALPFSSPAS